MVTTRPSRQNYPAMVKWVDHMSTYIADGIMPRDKYGDWCMPPENPQIIHSTDPARLTAGPLLGTAYFAYDLSLLSDYARLVNQPAEAQRFAELAAKMAFGLNAKYLNRQLGRYDNGTQTSSVLPLAFNLAPEDQRARVFSTLVDSVANLYHNHIGTGLIGAAWINRVLTDNGRADLAYAIATNRDFPSWGYMVEHGATTIWELWNGDTADVQMNSGNPRHARGRPGRLALPRFGGHHARPRATGLQKYFDAAGARGRPHVRQGLASLTVWAD